MKVPSTYFPVATTPSFSPKRSGRTPVYFTGMAALVSVTLKLISAPCPRTRLPSSTRPPMRKVSFGAGALSATSVGERKYCSAFGAAK